MACRILLFIQSGCLHCEVRKTFWEARGSAFGEHNLSRDLAARAELLETHHCPTARPLLFSPPAGAEAIEGFDPERLDRFLALA